MSGITQQQARLLCEAYDVYSDLESDEEVRLMNQHNPALLDAMYALHRVAVGADSTTDGGNEAEES